MADTRGSFILHIDSLSILEDLNIEQKGLLFDAIYNYQLGVEIDLDMVTKIAFNPFRNQFERDKKKYDMRCETNKSNGSKGGKQKVANASERYKSVANVADSDSDSDSDSDNDSGNLKTKTIDHLKKDERKIPQEIKLERFERFWDAYDNKVGKQKAKVAFLRLNNKEIDKIAATLIRFKDLNSDFLPHPSTYLNGKRWEDELPEKVNPNKLSTKL